MVEPLAPLQIPLLSEEEKEQLRLWAQATPSQRLAWLEEAMRLAASAKSGAESFPSQPKRL
jgi:hypothetical protein